MKKKYRLHETVWIMLGNKPKSKFISVIITRENKMGITTLYGLSDDRYVSNGATYEESRIFKTKEELISSL